MSALEHRPHPAPLHIFDTWSPIYFFIGMLMRKGGFSVGKMIVLGLTFQAMRATFMFFEGREHELANEAGGDLVAQTAGWFLMDVLLGKGFDAKSPRKKKQIL